MMDDFSAIWGSEPETYLRDAVWGDIPLYKEELALIDSVPFQRLRRIRQLGPLTWVFPGANHTRFEHALGVMHLARVLVLHLKRQKAFPRANAGDLRTMVASALLHDVGHYPFSHALEDVERPNSLPDHAEAGAALVRGPLASLLRNVWTVDPERVARLVAGTGHAAGPPPTGIDALWQAAISGAVDVDRLDFLRRDALFANVPYGIIDVQRILSSLVVVPDGGRPRLLLAEKGIGPFQSLIFGRFLMYGNVYWHHTGRIITRMIVRAVEDALERAVITPGELSDLDDSTLLDRLRHAPSESLACDLLQRIERRDLYKRAVELRPTDPAFNDLLTSAHRLGRTAAEAILLGWGSRVAGVDLRTDDLWLDLPQVRTFRPIDGVVCKIPPPGYQNPVPWEAVSGLAASDLDRLARSVQRVRVLATSKALADTIAKGWEADPDGVRRLLAQRAA